jgi:putative membrane protein
MLRTHAFQFVSAVALTAILPAVSVIASQGGAQPSQPQAPSSAAAARAATPASDADFVTQAAKASAKEIELGRLAARQASNTDVKAFANRMVTDHSKAADELTAIAKKHNMTMPTTATLDSEKKAATDKFMSMQGAAFDRAYMDQMVTAHRAAVELFEKESKDGSNAELKAFATKTLPTIREHLKEAEALQAKTK